TCFSRDWSSDVCSSDLIHPAIEKMPLRSIAILLGIVMATLGLALVLIDPVALQALRHQGFDQYQRWQPREYTPAPVRVIDIDERSEERRVGDGASGRWS